MLPASLLESPRKHLSYVSIHVRDLREGFGKVNLPYAQKRSSDTTLADGFAKSLLEDGYDIRTVQELVGQLLRDHRVATVAATFDKQTT
jgi:hypothetical protein